MTFDFFYKSAGLISCHIEQEFGGWSFHLFPERNEIFSEDKRWIWGFKVDFISAIKFWGLGPLFLAVHI